MCLSDYVCVHICVYSLGGPHPHEFTTSSIFMYVFVLILGQVGLTENLGLPAGLELDKNHENM